jgi:hypothetical protein
MTQSTGSMAIKKIVILSLLLGFSTGAQGAQWYTPSAVIGLVPSCAGALKALAVKASRLVIQKPVRAVASFVRHNPVCTFFGVCTAALVAVCWFSWKKLHAVQMQKKQAEGRNKDFELKMAHLNGELEKETRKAVTLQKDVEQLQDKLTQETRTTEKERAAYIVLQDSKRSAEEQIEGIEKQVNELKEQLQKEQKDKQELNQWCEGLRQENEQYEEMLYGQVSALENTVKDTIGQNNQLQKAFIAQNSAIENAASILMKSSFQQSCQENFEVMVAPLPVTPEQIRDGSGQMTQQDVQKALQLLRPTPEKPQQQQELTEAQQAQVNLRHVPQQAAPVQPICPLMTTVEKLLKNDEISEKDSEGLPGSWAMTDSFYRKNPVLITPEAGDAGRFDHKPQQGGAVTTGELARPTPLSASKNQLLFARMKVMRRNVADSSLGQSVLKQVETWASRFVPKTDPSTTTTTTTTL